MSGPADKVDFKRTLDSYRARRGVFRLLDLPPRQYLMVDGHGDPNSAPELTESVESLYPLGYALKFASKTELGRDYVVPPLEGLWWAADPAAFTSARDKSRWDWTGWTTPRWTPPGRGSASGRLLRAWTTYAWRRSRRAPACRPCTWGRSTTRRRCSPSCTTRWSGRGLRLAGKHHEIYLSDFRRVAPDRQRTILRQPVVPAEA